MFHDGYLHSNHYETRKTHTGEIDNQELTRKTRYAKKDRFQGLFAQFVQHFFARKERAKREKWPMKVL